MSIYSSVLVVGVDERSDLIETLFNLGYIPLIRKEMLKALDIIRCERFAAVFVDRSPEDLDILEFILNARDIDRQLPIIIVDGIADEDQLQFIFSLERVFVLDDNSAGLSGAIQRVID